MDLWRRGRYRATTTRVIAFAEIPSALRDLASRKTLGRVVAKP
jgi:NADPH:quinone reductase-like Zn-dependent oxidoreductase